jgi:hypothetical protein
MKNEYFWALVLTLLKNLGALTSFTILAIQFNKWWIVLFSGFFWSSWSYSTKNK